MQSAIKNKNNCGSFVHAADGWRRSTLFLSYARARDDTLLKTRIPANAFLPSKEGQREITECSEFI